MKQEESAPELPAPKPESPADATIIEQLLAARRCVPSLLAALLDLSAVLLSRARQQAMDKIAGLLSAVCLAGLPTAIQLLH